MTSYIMHDVLNHLCFGKFGGGETLTSFLGKGGGWMALIRLWL